jgi:hypothetical protein
MSKTLRTIAVIATATALIASGVGAAAGDRVWIGGNVVRLEVSAAGVTSAVERAVA